MYRLFLKSIKICSKSYVRCAFGSSKTKESMDSGSDPCFIDPLVPSQETLDLSHRYVASYWAIVRYNY